MRLQKFDLEKNAVNNENPIFLINFSEYYLGDLCERCNILDRIVGCKDDVPYRQGTHVFGGHEIKVTDYSNTDDIPANSIILILDSYPQGRFKMLMEISGISERFNSIYYYADMEMEYDLEYRDRFKDAPLENIILFRSGAGASRFIPGSDFGDNARALFEYMLSNHYDEKYQLVWLVKEPHAYEEKYRSRNVVFFQYDAATSEDINLRDKYYHALCLAKYIFFTNSCVFCRNARKDQIRIQLWHGCGLKSLRKSRIGRDEYKYEYTTVVSRLYAKLHMDDFGLREEQLLVTGYPKDDLLYNPIDGWNERLGVPKADKYIFWLPTWRTTQLKGEVQGSLKNQATGMPILENIEDMVKLNKILSSLKVIMVIKLHPWQNRDTIVQWDLSNIVLIENNDLVKEDIQISDILGHASALISDYSSVAIDFCLLDRPIAFTLDDQESYTKDRGFLWEDIRSWLPGAEIEKYDDMVKFIKEVANGIDKTCDKRRKLNELFHDYDDDQNSRRVLEALGI